MKKYDLLFLALGTLLSIIPVYVGLGWVYICMIYPELSQSETVSIYHSQILFNLLNGRYSSLIFSFLCGLVAGLLLLISLITSINRKDKFFKIVKIIIFSINFLFTSWMLFGLM